MTREEAIEVVKKNWPDSRYTSLKEALETLIPEFHESEDEKVRKFIQNELACLRASEDKGSERYNELTSAITYLEKQKDLHFEYPGLYFYDGEKLLFQGNPATEENPYDFAMSQQEKQKEQKPWKVGANAYFTPEQKPVEGDNETEIQKAFREGKSTGRKEVFDHPEEYGLQKPAEWNANDKAFIKDCARILDENGYAASAERLLSMFPIKPAEWSEEDEEMRKRAICACNFTIKMIMREDHYGKARDWLRSLPNGFIVNPNYNEDMVNLLVAELQSIAERNDASRQYDAEISWLKSLHPQPKQEVPADTEVLTAKLVNLLKSYRIGEVTATGLANRIADTYGTQRYLDGLCDGKNGEWKPSEEQMDRLFSIVAALRKDYCDDMADFLASLYKQLKAL